MTPFDPRTGDPLYVPGTIDFMPSADYVEGFDAGWSDREALDHTALRAFALGLTLGVLVAILLAALLAAPRSGQTTAPVDVSGMLSAGQSGAPLASAPAGVVPKQDLASGAPSPSPAVANVATSEGPQGPTTPMSATSS